MTDNQEHDLPDLSISKILIAILEELKSIEIPSINLLDAGNTDKELQVDYNPDNQSFIFKVR